MGCLASADDDDGRSGEGAIEAAVKVLLLALGEDCEREGLRKTPLRVAKAIGDGTKGYGQNVNDIVQGALFPEAGLDNGKGLAGGAGGLVVVRNIDLFSYCESCLLPFKVECHVGYIPSGERVVGLSKLARVADVFAKRLQSPKRLADEICSALQNSIRPAGVAVALQCWHIQFPETLKSTCYSNHPCNDMRGWHEVNACSTSGVLKDEHSNFWLDYVALLQFKGVNLNGSAVQNSIQLICNGNGTQNGHDGVRPKNGKALQSWCPSASAVVLPCNGHGNVNYTNGSQSPKGGVVDPAVIAAITSILRSIGEDPLRKELTATPLRFVQWMMRFKRATTNMTLSGLDYGDVGLYGNEKFADGTGEVCSELNLPFCAQCEHHLLPFHGVVHIGYIHAKNSLPIERSVLHTIVQFYGCKLQVQERLTRQIAEAVFSTFCKGVVLVVEANHICMVSRGVEKLGSSTATVATMGQFSTDPIAKASFLQSILSSRGSGK